MSAHDEAVVTKNQKMKQVTFIPTESGGMTDEAVIISCGGIAASHLQITNSKKQSIKGSSKTKKGESQL